MAKSLKARILEAIERDALKTGDTFRVDGVRYLVGAGGYSAYPETAEEVSSPAVDDFPITKATVEATDRKLFVGVDLASGPDFTSRGTQNLTKAIEEQKGYDDSWTKLGVLVNLGYDGPMLRVEAYWDPGLNQETQAEYGLRLKIMVADGFCPEDGYVFCCPTEEVVRRWMVESEALAVKAGYRIKTTVAVDGAEHWRRKAHESRDAAIKELLKLCEPLSEDEKRQFMWAAMGGPDGREAEGASNLSKAVALVGERLRAALHHNETASARVKAGP